MTNVRVAFEDLDIEHSSGNVAEPANARAQLEQQLQQSSISTEAPPLAATDDASDHQEGNISPVIDTTIESPQDISDPTPPPAHEQEEEVADEYLLKEIDWIDPNTGAEKRVKIITQNSMFWILAIELQSNLIFSTFPILY